MLILLYDSDSYRRIRRLKNLVDGYKNKYPKAAFAKFDFSDSADNGEQSTFFRFREFISNRSLFSDKKIVVLENIYGVAGTIDPAHRIKNHTMRRDSVEKRSTKLNDNAAWNGELKKILRSNLSLEDSIVIISCSKKPPADWNFLLKKDVVIEKFEELSGAELKSFAKLEIKKMNFDITAEALNFLTSFYKGNLWGLMTELEKLRWLVPKVSSIKYQVSREGIIDLAVVKRIGDYSEPQNIFSFLDSVENHEEWQKKLRELEKLLIGREEPAKIFNFLASRNHPPEFLEKLADYDIMVKSGKMDYEEVLLDLALE